MNGKDQEVKLVPVETRLPLDLYERLAIGAKENERSVAAELRLAVKAYLLKAATA